ncbi:MAG: hypothetical protein ACUZ8I_01500 [Candidatus Scalindua sp.]
MTEKELEKHNFLTWCRYATTEDLEKARGENTKVWGRLYSEYSDEIQIIDKTRHMYESISQHDIGIQRYDLSLKISI